MRKADGNRYAIQGFNSKAKKWPIKEFRISDGTHRKCGERFIKEFVNSTAKRNHSFFVLTQSNMTDAGICAVWAER
jgi:thiamine pyrophosphokinase